MFFRPSLLASVAALLVSVVASPLHPRQSSNTNPAIYQAISVLSQQIHVNIPELNTLQASGGATDLTVGNELDELTDAFTLAAATIANTAVSSGDTTNFPTNDDISITYAVALQLVASTASGLKQVNSLTTYSTMMSDLDPAIAALHVALNRTLPNSINLVRVMMLDAQQFLTQAGLTQSRASLGFA
ncbi:POXA3b laccase small subunit [Pleurotus eryngii]|uniref:POXA3b laccase small subunit n=2 Tax=Pleurotus eryngii TaxID=5323 RepID=A0A9P6DGH0_PLEER|nr:POXA3b laccase small subunit [Pleurotus eryngii]